MQQHEDAFCILLHVKFRYLNSINSPPASGIMETWSSKSVKEGAFEFFNSSKTRHILLRCVIEEEFCDDMEVCVLSLTFCNFSSIFNMLFQLLFLAFKVNSNFYVLFLAFEVNSNMCTWGAKKETDKALVEEGRIKRPKQRRKVLTNTTADDSNALMYIMYLCRKQWLGLIPTTMTTAQQNSCQ